MRSVVLSPHTDDAIFSLGAHLAASSESVVIASPFAGIPLDPAGKQKHETLRAEHEAACASIGNIMIVNGPFLDDVYESTPEVLIHDWLRAQLRGADVIYVPLGIHHPDHLTTSDLTVGLLTKGECPGAVVYFYEELPYRELYLELTTARLGQICTRFGDLIASEIPSGDAKERAVRLYASQTDELLMSKLMTLERVWRICQ